MNDVTARMTLDDGPAILVARNGVYDFAHQEISVPGTVNIQTADGYRMVTQGAAINLDHRTMASHGAVTGQVPIGTFSADHFHANLDSRSIQLDGHVRLHMVPGPITLPGQLPAAGAPASRRSPTPSNQVSKP